VSLCCPLAKETEHSVVETLEMRFDIVIIIIIISSSSSSTSRVLQQLFVQVTHQLFYRLLRPVEAFLHSQHIIDACSVRDKAEITK